MTAWGATRVGCSLLLAGLAGCQPPSSRSGQDDAALADTLRARIEDAYDFSRPGVADRMNALYPDTGRVISASGGQITASADSLRAGIAAFWQNVGRHMRDPKWVWGEVYVDRLSRDAAVLTATWSIPHIAPTGRPHVIRGAWTAVFRRVAGKWLIVAEHLSVPPT
ncbi:MAG TPA: nuclear transport factor 2 family protein [Gemmatimonadales bacterium]